MCSSDLPSIQFMPKSSHWHVVAASCQQPSPLQFTHLHILRLRLRARCKFVKNSSALSVAHVFVRLSSHIHMPCHHVRKGEIAIFVILRVRVSSTRTYEDVQKKTNVLNVILSLFGFLDRDDRGTNQAIKLRCAEIALAYGV